MKLPVPTTVIGRLAERFVLIAVAAGLADVLTSVDPQSGATAGAAYIVVKTILDIVNSNIPNWSKNGTN